MVRYGTKKVNINRGLRYTPISDLKAMARGRWCDILRTAGIPLESIEGRRGRPCPRCGGRDRFSPMADVADRGAVLCRSCHNQATEPRSGDGISTLRWWLNVDAAGALRWLSSYLGVNDGDHVPVVDRPIERRLTIPSDPIAPDRFSKMADQWCRAMRPEYLRRAADLLGLPVEPLERLGVGWSPEHRATSWPLCDGAGDVIGIRLRCPSTSKKWSVAGGRAGLIYAGDLLAIERPERLYIVEGPTDAAAMLSIGCDVVGVPSAGGGLDYLLTLCRRIKPVEIVVVADADGPGVDGAERIADEVMIVARVRIMSPGSDCKDARAWIVGGAGRSMIESTADRAPVRSLTIGGAA